MKPIPCLIKTVAVGMFAAFFATSASATLTDYVAILDGPSESPPNASPGTGFATFEFDSVANTLLINFSFSGLVGTTTASHIHGGTAVPGTGTAGVATTTPTFAGFPLGVTSGTYNNTLDLTQASSYNPAFVTANGGTTASAEAALIGFMNSDRAYLNIHTTAFPGGEIRGFITVVPEPSSIALMSVCGGAFAFMLRRRKSV